MARLDNLPDNTGTNDPTAAERALKSVTQDLQTLQHEWVAQLSQDIQRLQAEKSRLLNDIDRLSDQKELIQAQQGQLLSQQQLAQQQIWAKQLAKAMAAHLHALLVERINQSPNLYPPAGSQGLNAAGGTLSPPPTEMGYGDNAYQLLASLDMTLNHTLSALRNDLNSYQSGLSQQISRMQTLEQQGEAILEALVKRLSQQLQLEIAKEQAAQRSAGMAGAAGIAGGNGGNGYAPAISGQSLPPTGPLSGPSNGPSNGTAPPSFPPNGARPSPYAPAAAPPTTAPQSSWLWIGMGIGIGIGLVVLYALAQLVGSALAGGGPALLSPMQKGFWLAIVLAALFFFLVFSRYRTGARSRGGPGVFSTAPAMAPEAIPSSVRSPVRAPKLSQFQVGLGLILLSTLALSLHNVVVGIVYYKVDLFGRIPVGNFIPVGFGNSLLILWMRMLIVVPMMAALASFLYPSAWKDIKAFSLSKDRPLLVTVVGSGFFLFLSQVLIYIAIGQVGPGVAVTILFMYPIITVPLAWFLFGDRPTALRWTVMFIILSGVVMTALPKLVSTTSISVSGLTTAISSGIAFALYLIFMQVSFRKLHPVPVSLIQFVTIFCLASLSLIFLPNLSVEVPPENRSGLLVCGLILGTLTLLGYLMNNFGVRFMGAAMASIFASSGPVLTALMAFVITPGERTAMQPVQIIGILIVTIGVAGLSLERLKLQKKAVKPS